jgi:hypothetical protein
MVIGIGLLAYGLKPRAKSQKPKAKNKYANFFCEVLREHILQQKRLLLL